MAKSRQQRKLETREFINDLFKKYHKCFKETGKPSLAFKMFHEKYFDKNRYQTDQIYRQRLLVFRKELTTLIKTILSAYERESANNG